MAQTNATLATLFRTLGAESSVGPDLLNLILPVIDARLAFQRIFFYNQASLTAQAAGTEFSGIDITIAGLYEIRYKAITETAHAAWLRMRCIIRDESNPVHEWPLALLTTVGNHDEFGPIYSWLKKGWRLQILNASLTGVGETNFTAISAFLLLQ